MIEDLKTRQFHSEYTFMNVTKLDVNRYQEILSERSSAVKLKDDIIL